MRSFLTPKKLYIYQKEILIINVLKMKNLIKISVFALPILLGIYSCDNNRDNYDEIESISPFKIDSVKIAQPEMDVFTVQTIKTYSTYPNGCTGFYDYNYEKDDLDRYVTTYAYKLKNATCTQATRVETNGINFRPEVRGTYTFKFWNGKDANNNNVWIEKTIVVK